MQFSEFLDCAQYFIFLLEVTLVISGTSLRVHANVMVLSSWEYIQNSQMLILLDF